ncbi:helix-turn-helix domain-containing protein [Nesterenkonia alba]|uniref:helix-turn-helix domain-containing protein n=1 Tax=Nesterenkonia alba TaxID=515814 RepID=UPI0003B4927A|nr:helix-turn-helix domain-containing protein [Nesterenkonia alba]
MSTETAAQGQRGLPPEVTVSAEGLDVLRRSLGPLTTTVTEHFEQNLPWYSQLTTEERASLRLISQRGIGGLAHWLEDPASQNIPLVNEILGPAPTDLMRTISLQRALQLIRTIVDAVEERLPPLMPPADYQPMLEAVLRYSREVAFAIADVYARAAESRGAWDSRLEALLVDAVLRGEPAEQIASRAAAVGWRSPDKIAVVVGEIPVATDQVAMSHLRRACLRFATDAVAAVQGEKLILLLGGVESLTEGLDRVLPHFGEGPVVYSEHSGTVSAAHRAAAAAFCGYSAAGAWPAAPRPVAAEDLLPERALAGDETAKEALTAGIYTQLADAGHGLLETVERYAATGFSLEAAARELYVHTNTVRYRLKRVTEITGWDPTDPRDAYVLQTALVLGRL